MSCRGLQQRKQLKTDFREILRAAQFSTFSTASVSQRRPNMSAAAAAFLGSSHCSPFRTTGRLEVVRTTVTNEAISTIGERARISP
jgi:hypothetical protein